MSFANFDLESQKTLNKKDSRSHIIENQTIPQNGLDKIINNTTEQLHLFGGLISKFDSQRKHIGSRRDSIEFRNGIDELVTKVGDMDNAIKLLISNLSVLINKKQSDTISGPSNDNNLQITSRQLLLRDRVTNEYKSLHSQFVKASRVYTEKKRTFLPKNIENIPDETSHLLPKISESTQIQIQEEMNDTINETELQYQTMLTQEREREIERVSEAIQDVNMIFKDLGELVNQQGEQLDTIEDNMLQLQGNTKQADRELKKAHEYQKRKGKWSCIILVALCIFMLVVVLTIIS